MVNVDETNNRMGKVGVDGVFWSIKHVHYTFVRA
jgi:hypothetical protein